MKTVKMVLQKYSHTKIGTMSFSENAFLYSFSYRCERTFWGGSVCLTTLKQVEQLLSALRPTAFAFGANQVWRYHEYIHC